MCIYILVNTQTHICIWGWKFLEGGMHGKGYGNLSVVLRGYSSQNLASHDCASIINIYIYIDICVCIYMGG